MTVPPFDPNPESCLPALMHLADARAARSVERVAEAIAWLQKQGRGVSQRSIAAASATLRPGEPPLAVSTIARNPAAYRLYSEARTCPVRHPLRRVAPRNRWLERQSKAYLITVILADRETIAHLEKCLACAVFADNS